MSDEPVTLNPAQFDALVKAVEARATRVLLNRQEAAEALSMSLRSFDRYVMPHIRMVREGTMRLVPRSELVKWAERNARPLT